MKRLFFQPITMSLLTVMNLTLLYLAFLPGSFCTQDQLLPLLHRWNHEHGRQLQLQQQQQQQQLLLQIQLHKWLQKQELLQNQQQALVEAIENHEVDQPSEDLPTLVHRKLMSFGFGKKSNENDQTARDAPKANSKSDDKKHQKNNLSNTAEKEVDTLVGEIMMLKYIVSQKKSQKDQVEKRMKKMRLDIEDLNSNLNDLDKQIKEEEKNKRESQKSLEQIKKGEQQDLAEVINLRSDMVQIEMQIKRAREEYEDMSHDNALLKSEIQNEGLVRWLEYKGEKVLSKSALAALRKSVNISQPVMHRLKRAQNFRMKVTDRIDKVIPIGDSPFLSGLIGYLIFITPALIVLTTVVQLSRKAIQFTVSHHVLFASLILTSQALICFIATLFSGEEVMSLLQKNHEMGLTISLIIWMIMYIGFLGVMLLSVVVERDPLTIFQSVASFFVGFHFYFVVWKKVMLDEEPTIRAIAYLIYATIFIFVINDKKEKLKIVFPGERSLLSTIRRLKTLDLNLVEQNTGEITKTKRTRVKKSHDSNVSDLLPITNSDERAKKIAKKTSKKHSRESIFGFALNS